MHPILIRLRDRLAPAALTAAGLTVVAAGLYNLAGPVEAGGTAVVPTDAPASDAGPIASLFPPGWEGSGAPSGPPDIGNRVATRIVVPALRIDLAIVKQDGGPEAYPYCGVAMYIQEMGQPGGGRTTYIYAHARTGMFLPLLTQSKIDNGSGMIGMIVQVYTSDDRLYLYEITEVLRHQLTLERPLAVREEELWMQTSEGAKGTPQKLQVRALPISSGAAPHTDAHPVAKPIVCG